MPRSSSFARDFYRVVESAVKRAVANPENINTDGTINWNFVDSDCYMTINPTAQCAELYYELWEEACDAIEMETV